MAASARLSASGFWQVSDAANLAPGLSARTYGWTARANVSFRVSRTFDLQSFLFYQSPLTVEEMYRMLYWSNARIAPRSELSSACRVRARR